MSLKGKKIVLGVTGSIATYKAPLLVRELIREGAEVHCVMTPSSQNFTTPMVLSNVSDNPVVTDMFSKEIQHSGAWHIHLARECDAMLIAPCSAATLGKIAHGICDNALVTVATAVPIEIPIVISPAMDTNMWINPITQENCRILEEKIGATIIQPDDGSLSSGLTGPGRFPDITVVIEELKKVLKGESEGINDFDLQDEPDSLEKAVYKDKFDAELALEKMKSSMGKPLQGKKVLITAGPTHERIDDVRYIANYSSGKMGYALAETANMLGAEVILISGPVNLKANKNIKVVDVVSAQEMFDASVYENENNKIDIAIHAAAVADFTPETSVIGKIKKTKAGESMALELRQTKDILSFFGQNKKEDQYLVGFALEYSREKEYGRNKLVSKNCDMIIVNSAAKPNSGFGGDDNTITILTKNGEEVEFAPMPKPECAKHIFDKIIDETK
jgi:phosphopantothenoylcysteine decarboxylase/phosphopantothenate--cysteine ligase